MILKDQKINEIIVTGKIETEFLGIFQFAPKGEFVTFPEPPTDSLLVLKKSYLNLLWPDKRILFGVRGSSVGHTGVYT